MIKIAIWFRIRNFKELDESLLRSSPFERPTQIFTDFQKLAPQQKPFKNWLWGVH